jgi:ATP-dependent DNA ligase
MKYEPMLAESGDLSLLEKDDYIFEPKLDGSRCVLVKRGRRIYMFNRLGQDISYLYPLIKKDFEEYDDDFMLDGEIICYNERGQPDHRLLMRRSLVISKNEIDMNARAIPATFVAFDILIINRDELITKQLEERKAILKKLIKETNHVERMLFTEEGNKLWTLTKKSNMEGIMAKKKKSYYYPGKRSKA